MVKTIKEFYVANKKVLVRCDFNVPLNFDSSRPQILDDFKLRKTIPTINYLVRNGAKVILMSHLGDPQKFQGKAKLSLKPIVFRLEKLLRAEDGLGPREEKNSMPLDKASTRVRFVDDCVGKNVEEQVQKLQAGDVLVLENLRFRPEEQENDQGFARRLAGLADIYINEAFSVSHRSHASIVSVPKYLPSGVGLLSAQEIKVFSKILEDPWRPLVVIIGGAKISSKTKFIKQFLQKADHLLIGGKVANTILTIKGICIGRPWPSEDVVATIQDLNLTSTKLHLPVDAIVSPDVTGKLYIRESAPGKVRKDELLLDVGPETIQMFSRIIESAKMIVWAGPLGFFENSLFEKGTKSIADKIIRNHQAFKVAGGGDTVFALSKFGVRDKFDHVSTGGGAMLQFLSGERLPGLIALDYYGNRDKKS